MTLTLFLYSTKKFLKAIGLVYSVVLFAFATVDLIEIIRRTSSKETTTLQILSHTTLQIPFVLQETFVLVVLAASIYTFLQIAKNNEYTIVKSSGVSIWKFLAPFVFVVITLSIFIITVVNPISAKFLERQQRVVDRMITGKKHNPTAVFESGFWLIDHLPNINQSLIINANTVIIGKKDATLLRASIIEVDQNFQLIKTLEAQRMDLKDNNWILQNVIEYEAKKPKTHIERLQISTEVTYSKLRSNFKRPDLISVWELPYFMKTLKATGHSTKSYIIYFYKLLIKPFVAITLLLIAASFTLHPPRYKKLSKTLTLCLAYSFFIYIIVDMTYTIGNNYMLSIIGTTTLITILIIIGILRIKQSKI